MDELTGLGALGMGLSAAGGALSPEVYQTNANMYSNQQAQDARKKEYLAGLLTQHLQQGTISPDSYKVAMGKLGYDVPQMSPPPDYSGAATSVMSRLDGGGLGGQPGLGAPPATPPAQPASAPAQFGGGTALGGGSGVVGGGAGFGATGAPVPGAAQAIPPVNGVDKSTWDKREDGSTKGTGFLGVLKRPDGGVSTEISVGVNINGKEMEIPTLVPTLTKQEVDYLLSGGRPTDAIVQKAAEFAKGRIAEGKSVFASDAESKQMPTTAPGASATPGADQDMPTVGVNASKIKIYSTDEINAATSEYAKSISGQPGTIQAKQKAVKDFRDSLKAERKSQLDEFNKLSEADKRENDIRVANRDRNRTPLLNNLDALAKMSKDDPRYGPLKAAIDKETSGNEQDTQYTKELKQHLRASGLKEGTPEYNAKFAQFTKQHLDKMDAPSSTTLQTNAANEMPQADIDYLAKQVIAGDKSVMSGYSRAPQVRMKIQQAVTRIARDELHYTPEHLAVMGAEFKGMEAAQRTAGTREAQLGFAVSELANFVPLASAASDKVPRSGFKPINQLIQSGENQWSPEQAAFVAANRSVINAFAQVASRGVPTVHSTEEAEKMLNTAQSHDAYKAVLKQLQLEARAAQNAPKDVRKDLSEHIENRGKGPVATPAAPGATPKAPPSLDDLLKKY